MCVTANSHNSCPITADAERPVKRHKGRAQDAPQVVVLDIEGTVAPVSFVYDVMFPYAKKKLQSYLEKNWDTAEMRSEVQQLQAEVSFARFLKCSLQSQQLLAAHASCACSAVLFSQYAVGKVDICRKGCLLSSVQHCYKRRIKAMCMCRQS